MQKPVERMTLQAERVGVTLSQDCPPDLPLVFADPGQISQVFVNLIHNAIKFTPNNGRIHVTAFQDGQMVVFKVSDNGVGIATKDVNRIFERFYKADRARSGGGTGLGLSICKHIVEAHGGKFGRRASRILARIFSSQYPWCTPKTRIDGSFATQSPLARDLCLLASRLEVIFELVRIGDYAKGIARGRLAWLMTRHQSQ